MSDAIAEFAQRLEVQKPNKVKKDDTNGQIKLEACLNSSEYALEKKIDGCHYKMIANRFFSLDNVEKTLNYPHLVAFFKELKMINLILDGEINYPGKTSQYCVSVTGASPDNALAFQKQNGYIHYTIFDILRLPDTTWLSDYTYIERRKILETFYSRYIEDTPMEQYIHLSEVVYEDKRHVLDIWLAEGEEGGVIKRLDGIYHHGSKKKWEWMKIKQNDTTDLIIMGFEPPKKLYTGNNVADWPYWVQDNDSGDQIPVTKYYYNDWIGNVILGAYDEMGNLRQVCAASGMTEDVRIQMTADPDAWIGKVAMIEYMELTSAGLPRHPSYVGIHPDKPAKQCIWEF